MTDKKKSKLKVKWKVAAPALACVVLFVYLIISLLISLFSDKKSYNLNNTIGKLDGKQTYKVIMTEDRENPLLVKDYNFYGESLDLYFDSYIFPLAATSTLKDSTILLKDLAGSNEIAFENISGDIDRQIDLTQLPEGFYSVYRVTKETTQRLYYNGKLASDNIFYTVTRNGYCSRITLIANKEYFDEADKKEKDPSLLDKNYLYIKVEKYDAKDVNEYDIAIQTSPALTSRGVSLSGDNRYGLVESEEVYAIGLKVKELLEAKGLRVLMLKDEHDQDILFYGEESTLEKAYDSGAKYLINLDMIAYEPRSIGCLYSYYASNQLAYSIYNQLTLKTTIYDGREETALRASEVIEEYLCDDEYEIREAGGRATAAGSTTNGSLKNSGFAANNKYGMNTVTIAVADFDTEKTITKYKENKDMIAPAIAEGILEYLKIAN